MKKTLLLIAGISTAIAYVILTRPAAAVKAAPVVDELAHKLQDAWADHHTVA